MSLALVVCGWCAGIACKLDSPGFAALKQATKEVKGNAEPYSICGSLPLVGDMQEDGFDVQVRGRLPHPSCAWYLGRSEGGGAGRCAASGSPASTMVRETSCLTSRCKLPRLLVRPCAHWWLSGRGQRVLQAERYGGRGQDSVALPCFGQRVSRQAPANARELAAL